MTEKRPYRSPAIRSVPMRFNPGAGYNSVTLQDLIQQLAQLDVNDVALTVGGGRAHGSLNIGILTSPPNTVTVPFADVPKLAEVLLAACPSDEVRQAVLAQWCAHCGGHSPCSCWNDE